MKKNYLYKLCSISTCKVKIYYSRRYELKIGIKNHTKCPSCRLKGSIRLDMIGDNNPMKKIENKLKHSQLRKGKNNNFYGKHPWNYGLGNERLSEFQKYLRDVNNITRKNINKISGYDKNKRGRAGILGAYHVDHIISIRIGFKNNILSSIIGDVFNLQFIPWEENQERRELPKKYNK